MKNGLIVYLVSSDELPENFDATQAVRTLGHGAQRVELVSSQQGFFTVEDAWHFLVTRGCGRISLLVAEWEEAEKLRPLGPAVRLYG
jgi:hypothetical protein